MDNSKNLSIASLVCGIIGVVLAWFGYGAILALALGIVATVLSVKARKDVNNPAKSMATAGLVLGIIAIVLGGLLTLCVVACAGAYGCAACASAL